MGRDTSFEFGYNAQPEEQTDPNTTDPNMDLVCMGSVYCSVCRKHHGYCSEVETQIKGENMLPRAEENDSQSAAPRRGKTGGLRYLKNEDLSANHETDAKIQAVKPDANNRFGAAVVLKLTLNGTVIFWTVRTKNPNYKILTDKLGHEENDWVGQKILLKLEQDDFSESYFPRVGFPTEATTGGKSRGRSGN